MTDQHGGDLYWAVLIGWFWYVTPVSIILLVVGTHGKCNNADHFHDMLWERQTVMMVHADKLLDYHSINGRHATGIKYNFPI